MNQKELKELIDFLIEKDISEFELERGDVKVRIKRGADSHSHPMAHAVTTFTPVHVPVTPAQAGPGAPPPSTTPPPAVETAAAPEENLHIVKSPIVGTFYEAPAPGSPPFVKPGDAIQAGQVLCIIEAMKLMNEIEADIGGEVVKRLVANGQPVEYGQPLFAIRAHA
ncbi:MAG TPA: acetyl-CoA carboxylase biotin carboxyl carrier protein [Candidatus Angelobacter sp.]|nr:acetyl-CoA carboxylase biotin carboxyl carrier protein [Candidatus Angelobacter sp.]